MWDGCCRSAKISPKHDEIESARVLLQISVPWGRDGGAPCVGRAETNDRKGAEMESGERQVRRSKEKHRAELAHLRSKEKYYEGQPALRTTVVFSEKSRDDESDRAGNNGSRSEEGQGKGPDRNCDRTN